MPLHLIEMNLLVYWYVYMYVYVSRAPTSIFQDSLGHWNSPVFMRAVQAMSLPKSNLVAMGWVISMKT